MEQLTASSSQPVMSQKELLGKKLLEIKENVTREDRKNCTALVRRSKLTIDRYLNGHVYDISTGFDILNYLNGQIELRNKSLK